MRRRDFLAGTAMLLMSPRTKGHAPSKSYHVGFLSSGRPADSNTNLEALNEELNALGYADRIAFESKYAEGDLGRLRTLAGNLAALDVDALIAAGNPAVDAARHATQTIPIVMFAADPVAAGFVPSLAHPGGNLTGLTVDAGLSIWSKRLQLLKECAPAVTRVGVISRTGGTQGAWVKVLDTAARKLGVSIIHAGAQNARDFSAAFSALSAARIDGLVGSDTPLNFQYRRLIIEFAARARLPAVHAYRQAAEDGGLMSYGVDVKALYRRAASYLNRIFKGASPANLPIEQPTRFELVISAKAAEALGLPLPPSLLLTADRVIK